MSGKARAAVIGVGTMGRQHARVYSQIEGADLVAVADVDEQTARRVASEYGVQYYTDHLQMLEEEKRDLVSLAVPTSLHHQLALDGAPERFGQFPQRCRRANPLHGFNRHRFPPSPR